MASSFRVLNSSTGLLSHPLALLTALLPRAHLTLLSRISGSGWLITPSSWPGSLKSFLYSSSVYSLYLFLIYSASTRSLLFLSFIVSIFLGKMFPWYLQFSWRDLLSFPFCCFLLVLCTVHWRRPSCCSMLFFGNLHLVGYTFPFLPCFLLLFFL